MPTPFRACILAALVVAASLTYVALEENYLPPVGVAAGPTDGRAVFSEVEAHRHLVALASDIGIRRAGEAPNEEAAVDYLVDALRKIKGSSKSRPDVEVEIDVQRGDGSFTWTNKSRGLHFKEPIAQFESGAFYLYRNVSNVVARIRFSPNAKATTVSRPAVLFSAHFDSAKTSPGASDDCIHVAALVELVRVLSHGHGQIQPGTGSGHDVIVLLNGAEEVGLLGSHLFMSAHRWAADVDSWVNLEATGAGGRLMYFRAMGKGSGWLTRLYSAAGGGFGASTGGDIYKTGLLSGYTDAEVYGRLYGLPGIDLVLYKNAYVYHSPLDNVQSIDVGTLQGIGQTITPIAKAIAAMPARAGAEAEAESEVEVGLLPIIGAVSEPAAALAVTALASALLVGVATALVVWPSVRGPILRSVASAVLSVIGGLAAPLGVAFVLSQTWALGCGPIASWFARGPIYAILLFAVPTVCGVLASAVAFPPEIFADGNVSKNHFGWVGVSVILASLSLVISVRGGAPVSALFPLIQMVAAVAAGVGMENVTLVPLLALVGVGLAMSAYITLVLTTNIVPMTGRMSAKFPADLAVAGIVASGTLLCLSAVWAMLASSTSLKNKEKQKQKQNLPLHRIAFFVALALTIVMCAHALVGHDRGAPFTPERQQRFFLQFTTEVEQEIGMCGAASPSTVAKASSHVTLKSFGGAADRLLNNPMLPGAGKWVFDPSYPGWILNTTGMGNGIGVNPGSMPICIVSDTGTAVSALSSEAQRVRRVRFHVVHPHTPHSMLILTSAGSQPIKWSRVQTASVSEHVCVDGRCSIEVCTSDPGGAGWDIVMEVEAGVEVAVELGVVDYAHAPSHPALVGVVDVIEGDGTMAIMLSPRVVDIWKHTLG